MNQLYIASLLRELCFHKQKKKKNSSFSCRDTENGAKRSEKWFINRLYLRNYPADWIKLWYGGKASVPFFGIISVAIDERIEILWRLEFFEQCL